MKNTIFAIFRLTIALCVFEQHTSNAQGQKPPGQKVGRVGANVNVSLHRPNAAAVKSGLREMPYNMDRGEGTCTNTDNGAQDDYGDGCAEYANNKHWCGGYNNAVFQSDAMCCACGGGKTEEQGGCNAPGGADWKNDEICDDGNNNADCDWDGGDCCGEILCEDGGDWCFMEYGGDGWKEYCDDCKCLDPALRCFDKFPKSCPPWAVYGDCTSDKDYMDEYCFATCNPTICMNFDSGYDAYDPYYVAYF